MSNNSNLFLGDYSNFNPHKYLDEYFSKVETDCKIHIKFLVELFSKLSPVQTMIDYGCGPVVYNLMPAFGKVQEIHLIDYNSDNLDEIQRWLQSDPSAFDWSEYTRLTLKQEGVQEIDESTIAARENWARQTITKISTGDITKLPPRAMHQSYDIVMSNFCLDAASTNSDQFRENFNNLLTLLKPQGLITLGFLTKCSAYKVGDVYFQNYFIDEKTLHSILVDAGFSPDRILLTSEPFRDQYQPRQGNWQDYQAPEMMILVVATR